MRKAGLALATVLALALPLTTALAQGAPPAGAPAQAPGGGPGQGPGGFAQRRMQALLNGITLTQGQQARIDSIQASYQGRMPAFTPGVRPDSAQMAQRRALTQQMDAEIRGVLTAEQQQVWDRNMEQLRQNMMQRRPGG